jgi:hypothetical protein
MEAEAQPSTSENPVPTIGDLVHVLSALDDLDGRDCSAPSGSDSD